MKLLSNHSFNRGSCFKKLFEGLYDFWAHNILENTLKAGAFLLIFMWLTMPFDLYFYPVYIFLQ